MVGLVSSALGREVHDRERGGDVHVGVAVSARADSRVQGNAPEAPITSGRRHSCHYHRDLLVWQFGLELARRVYVATADFPSSEKWGLVEQLRRAAVSVPSNIAEGAGRGYTRDFVHFLRIARGSLAEVETQLRIADGVGYLRESRELFQLIERIERMLGALIAALCRRGGSTRTRMPMGADSANVDPTAR